MNSNNGAFSVTLVNEAKGLKKNIQVTNDEYILDVAEEQGINLPYSCRSASCSHCLGKIIEGTVEQNERALTFLRRDEIEAGYILTCAASPTSNCTIITHQEEEFFS